MLNGISPNTATPASRGYRPGPGFNPGMRRGTDHFRPGPGFRPGPYRPAPMPFRPPVYVQPRLLPARVSDVPPTAVTYGDAAGNSTP